MSSRLPCGYNQRFKTALERFEEKVQKTSSCWRWIGAVNKNGYGSFGIGDKTVTASRAAYQLYIGQIPQGRFVCHHCDNPLCVRPEHLYAGTHRDNMRDKVSRGRAKGAIGERNTKAKLSTARVLKIRESDLPSRELATRHQVSMSTIQRIRNGSTWGHV